MAKFKVGDNPRASFPIGSSTISGGTWHTPEGVGSTEEYLRREFPFLIWDSPAKPKLQETPKPAIPITKPKAKKK